ncbi:MAG: Hpt domain-containing protein [Opitutales bacterium]|jgi:two-component system, sensor histidine kinase and response regulator|nr:Hpt domain-containing protein [Opitutales bacterium]
MHDVSHSLPDHLPGIQVAFALKQCLGRQDLLITLLNKFWEDYKGTSNQLKQDSLDSDAAEKLLHNLQGAATNLGLSDLGTSCQQLRDSLKSAGDLSDEERSQFHMELEKVGGSIKTLDSTIQS